MTTQNAGRQATDKAGGAAPIEADPSLQEADRLASMIRPAWEMDFSDGEEAPAPAALDPAAAAPPPVEPIAAKGGEDLSDAEKANFDRIAARLSQGSIDPVPTFDPVPTSGATTSQNPPRDTVIEGVPTVGVGERTSQSAGDVSAAIAQGIAIVDAGSSAARPSSEPLPAPQVVAAPPPPQRAGPTKLGLGDENDREAIANAIAEASKPAPPPPAPVAGSPNHAAAASRAKFGGTVRMDAAALRPEGEAPSAPPRAPARSSAPPAPVGDHASPELAAVAPQGASFSKADDPIEIPVEKRSKTVLVIAGLALAAAAVVGGVMIFGGSSDAQKSDAKTETKQTESKPEAKSTAKATSEATAKPAPAAPTDTATATATASETASASAPPLASASASAAETATPTASASVASAPSTDKPKPSSDKPKSSGTSKPDGGKTSGSSSGSNKTPKPSSSGGGGIIRQTPF